MKKGVICMINKMKNIIAGISNDPDKICCVLAGLLGVLFIPAMEWAIIQLLIL